MKGEYISTEYIAELMDIEDITLLMQSYIAFCTGQAASPNLESPHSPDTGGTGDGRKYYCSTEWERLVKDHTGLNFHEIENLDYIEYLTYRKDAYIYMLNQTEGRQRVS